MTAFIIFLVAFIVWALLHSLTAAIFAKQKVRLRLGDAIYDGWYRLFYNGFSLLTFVPVYILVRTLPSQILWSWSSPYLYLATLVQVAALIGLFISLWVTDIWYFIGLRQAAWYLRRSTGAVPPPPFTISGPYRLVRHPLYFFSLLLLWFNPVMTVGSFIFYTAVFLYFWIGSYYEEKKLAASYGDTYTRYQQRVSRLLPLLF